MSRWYRSRHWLHPSAGRPPGALLATALGRLCLLASALLLACASPPAGAPGGPQLAPAAAPGPKSLVVATTIEAPGFGEMFAGGTSGPEHLQAMLHRALAQVDDRGEFVPEVAGGLPNQADGTWKLFPDGRMETIWKLRPGVRWHDGTALTIQDVIFSWQVYLAPDVPYKQRQAARLIEDIVGLDADTFAIRWRGFYLGAGRLTVRDLFLLPRHRLEQSFLNDREGFVNASYWNTEFIGVGPYRLARWEPGSFAQLERFEGFYGQPAPIQSITVRFVQDTNTAIANILSGQINLMLGRSLGLEHAQLLKAQWESRGEGRVLTYPRGIFEIRFAPGDPKVADLALRKALYHAIDRESIVRDLYGGLLEVAHSYIAPGTSGFEAIDAVTTRYRYDLAKAAELLEPLGWRRARDGLLRNDRGEAYVLPFATTAGNQERVELQTAIADMWKTGGFDVRIQNVPLSVQRSDEYSFPTTDLSGVGTDFESNIPRIDGRNMRSPGNPRGQNVWGYASVEVDGLLDEWRRTLERSRQIEIEAAVIHRLSEDLPILPVNYRIEVVAVGKGVTGVPRRTELLANNSAWNVETWDLK